MLQSVISGPWETSVALFYSYLIYVGLRERVRDATDKSAVRRICLVTAAAFGLMARGLFWAALTFDNDMLWNGIFACAAAVASHGMVLSSLALARHSPKVKEQFLGKFFDPAQGVYITAYVILLAIGGVAGIKGGHSSDTIGGGLLCLIAAGLFLKLWWVLHRRDELLAEWER